MRNFVQIQGAVEVSRRHNILELWQVLVVGSWQIGGRHRPLNHHLPHRLRLHAGRDHGLRVHLLGRGEIGVRAVLGLALVLLQGVAVSVLTRCRRNNRRIMLQRASVLVVIDGRTMLYHAIALSGGNSGAHHIRRLRTV